MLVVFKLPHLSVLFHSSLRFLCLALLGLTCAGSAIALTVQDVIRVTVSSHPAILSQLAQHEAALVDVRTARQQFYPTPSLVIEQVKGSSTDWTYGSQSSVQTLRLQQPLWTAGRLTAGLDKSQSNAQASRESANDMRQQLAFRAVQGWTDWYQSALRIQAQMQSVQTHERFMSVVRRRVDEGAMASSELSLTKSRLDQAEAQLQSFKAQLRVARLRLAQLMGHPIANVDEPEVSTATPQCASDAREEQTIAASAALRKITAQLQALAFELNERQADLAPELYLRLERQRSPGAYGAVTMTADRVYVGFSSRFGPGLSNLTVLESLSKRRDALQADYDAAKRNVVEAVQSEQEQLSAIETRLPLLRSAVDESVKTAQSWDRQFLAGRRAWVEVMNAARETAQAQIDWSDARASQIGAQWRMGIYCGQLQDLLSVLEVPHVQEVQR